MEMGVVIEAEEPYIGPDGIKRVFLSTKSPLKDEMGRIIGVIGVSRDITDRKRAEAAGCTAVTVSRATGRCICYLEAVLGWSRSPARRKLSRMQREVFNQRQARVEYATPRR
jgi:hypothetical protein